jgi:arsenate reductase-like glutaredoxin family protein
MKIDVEGAELKVLSGLEGILQNNRELRTIYCEVHPDLIKNYGRTAEEIKKLLEESGFEVKKIHNREGQYYLKATKKAAVNSKL